MTFGKRMSLTASLTLWGVALALVGGQIVLYGGNFERMEIWPLGLLGLASFFLAGDLVEAIAESAKTASHSDPQGPSAREESAG